VGLSIWRWSGIKKSRTIELSLSRVATDFGIGRATAARGLGALSEAGLIRVEPRSGRRMIVTIIAGDYPPQLQREDAFGDEGAGR